MWPKSSFTTPAVAAISFCLIGGTSRAAADIIHVPGDFLTIQEAIDAAIDGDEVEVHPGSYNEAIDFLGKAINVHSSDGPDVTTIDATGLNTSVVSCVNLEGSDSVLDGFTVTGGNAVQGGGMLIELSDPCVLNCIFVTNQATRGGGVYCRGSSPVFRDCVFSSNTATDLQDGAGGGMYCAFGSNAKLTDCVFEDNFALDDGGGIANISNSHTLFTTCVFTANTADRGGGIFNVQSDPIIIGSTFANNMAIDGGAIYNSGSQPTIQDCAFDGNSAVSTGFRGWGGAIHNLNSFSPIVTSCLFRRNLASGGTFGARGGAMFNRNSHPVVSDCDFIENSVVNTVQKSGNNAYGGAIFNRNGSSPIVTNCRFIANAAKGVFSATSRRGGAIYNDVG
ncbi:MAG: right-handed parallel beta-helix repeat-containing protein, partial [Pseudomonadales bacterium]